MIKLNDKFEDILSKLIEVSSRPELIEMQISLFKSNEIFVFDIYLDDCEDSDSHSFNWQIGKKLYEQEQETQSKLKLLLCQ